MSKIVQLPDKKLRTISEEVTLPLSAEDEQIVNEMIDYINESQQEGSTEREGIGIAAVQLGYLKRMFYVNVPMGDEELPFVEFFINPKFVKTVGKAALASGEGCLSVPVEEEGQQGLVHRYDEVVISYYSYFKKKKVQLTKKGFEAIVLQHEMDHLDGRLFIDRIDKKEPFHQLEEEELI